LSLHCSDFSTISYEFSEYKQNDYTIGDSLSRRGPCNFSKPHRYAPSSQLGPWKDLGASNWVPRPNGRRGSLDFAGSGGAFIRGGGGARPRAHLGPYGGQSWGGRVAGEGVWRWLVVAVAVAAVPARGAQHRAGRDLGWCCRSLWRCSRARWPKGQAGRQLARRRPWRRG
jgi:hypothetical protein